MSRQTGISLIELMVALAIGGIIILGAGQLYLSMLTTFQQVEALSRRQEVLIFIADTLIRDLRNAQSIVPGTHSLELAVPRDPWSNCPDTLLQKNYYLSGSETGRYSLNVSECIEPGGWVSSQPLIQGLHSANAFSVEGNSDGRYQLTLHLTADNSAGYETFVVNVQNRLAALAHAGTGSEE
ncbi:PilW family protein [Halomonas sp. LS-001]